MHAAVGLGRAEPVDRRDAGHHQHVAPREQRVGGGVPQLVDLLVDRGVLLDVGVGGRDVGLGLVVVVVGDEVLHGVVGEELAELGVELPRQRLVGRHHQRRPIHPLDHARHAKRLPAARDAQQRLVGVAALDALHQLLDGARLVAGGLELGDQAKALGHRRTGHHLAPGALGGRPAAGAIPGPPRLVLARPLDAAHVRSSSATARAAMPSPRPRAPR